MQKLLNDSTWMWYVTGKALCALRQTNFIFKWKDIPLFVETLIITFSCHQDDWESWIDLNNQFPYVIVKSKHYTALVLLDFVLHGNTRDSDWNTNKHAMNIFIYVVFMFHGIYTLQSRKMWFQIELFINGISTQFSNKHTFSWVNVKITSIRVGQEVVSGIPKYLKTCT